MPNTAQIRSEFPPRPQSVYVAFEAFPRPKGAASHIAAMVTALARRHAPVWLLCCGYADMPALQVEEGVIIHRFKVHHPNLLRRAKEFATFVYAKLAPLVPAPELIVFRDPWGGWPAVSAQPKAAAVFEVNGLPCWELPATHPAVAGNAGLMAKIEDMERTCLAAAEAVITVSELTRSALVDRGVKPDIVHIVPNSAADTFFRAAPANNPLDVLDQGRWFGYVGSLHPWQGAEILVRAWALIAPEYPDVRMILVHNGRRPPLKVLRKKCRKLGLEGRVVFQAPLSPERLAGVMARLEFTTAPLLETFRNTVQGCCPVKIVESMAAGTPVLASDLAVNRALVEHGHNGLLARPGKVRDWAQGLKRLIDDGDLRSRLARNAGRTANRRYAREVMFDRLDRVFDRAVQAARENLEIRDGTAPGG